MLSKKDLALKFKWLIFPWIAICVLAFLPALLVIWLSNLMGLDFFKDCTEEPELTWKK